MKKGFSVLLAFLCLGLGESFAAPSYRSVLKKWTRHDQVFVWDNFEARLIWHATYLSDEYRRVRLERQSKLLEWSVDERLSRESEDRGESQKYDVFFLSIYAGSSQWPEVGKDSGKWKIVLQQGGGEPIASVQFERVPVTQVERELFPFLDKWSHGYVVKFPKTIRSGEPFRLRMTGIPARSELSWKNR